ncbi:MAG: hypothetical protein ACXITV_01015 [Luteibaculaceae bacterium]
MNFKTLIALALIFFALVTAMVSYFYKSSSLSGEHPMENLPGLQAAAVSSNNYVFNYNETELISPILSDWFATAVLLANLEFQYQKEKNEKLRTEKKELLANVKKKHGQKTEKSMRNVVNFFGEKQLNSFWESLDMKRDSITHLDFQVFLHKLYDKDLPINFSWDALANLLEYKEHEFETFESVSKIIIVNKKEGAFSFAALGKSKGGPLSTATASFKVENAKAFKKLNQNRYQIVESALLGSAAE